MNFRFVFVALSFLSTSLLANTEIAAAQEKGRGVSAYIIGPEDMLEISVWKNPDLSRTVPVRPDGKISLPLLSDVQAAGLTPATLAEDLTKRLTEYIPVPQVSVIVTAVQSFKISILGEVAAPGRYDIHGRMTVLDALAVAGRFSDFASPSKIYILRQDGEAEKRIPFNYNKVLAEGGEKENIFVQPNDVIVIP
jgi:polysaccharide export outer membrane protein